MIAPRYVKWLGYWLTPIFPFHQLLLINQSFQLSTELCGDGPNSFSNSNTDEENVCLKLRYNDVIDMIKLEVFDDVSLNAATSAKAKNEEVA